MPSSRNRPSSVRPLGLELLEDRTLPSTTTAPTIDLSGLTVNPNQYSSTDILVRFRTAPASVLAGTTVGPQLPLVSGLYEVRLSGGVTVAQALAAYRKDPAALSAEPDYTLGVSQVPNDPLFNQQWGLNNTGQTGGTPGASIHAEQAWDVTTGNPSVVVAVMDTGIDYNNPDLVDNIWVNQAEVPDYWYTRSSPTSGYDKIVYKWQIKTATPGLITFDDLNNPVNAGLVWHSDGNRLVDPSDLLRPLSQGGWESHSTRDGDTAHPDDFFGWNCVTNTNNPFDDNGHGTHVAGILGATGDNGVGVAGVDWHVQMMPVKFLNGQGQGSIAAFINGLNYAVQHGAKISNNSWEGAPDSQDLYDAISNARAHGQIFVVAAGNDGANTDQAAAFPADFPLNNVVSVAATDQYDRLASFSNYGAHTVDLGAPGVNILSTLPGGNYGRLSGTSMATPFVSGAMALVWGEHPSWTYTQVIDQVLNTVDRVPSLEGRTVSGGVLDLAAAVGWNLSTRTTPTITAAVAEGPTSGSMDSIWLTFNEPIDVSSFTSGAVRLTGPNGQVIPVTVRVVNNSGDLRMALIFSNQTAAGAYHLSIGSQVHDLMGDPMTPYQATFTVSSARVSAPVVTAAVPHGPSASSMNSIWLTFNQPINVRSFTAAAVRLTAPNGRVIPVTVRVASDSGDRRLALIFSNQTAAGTYHLAISSAVHDQQGKALVPHQATFTLHAAQTFTHATRSTIPRNGLDISTLAVNPNLVIGNIEVRLNISYPRDGDLYIHLQAPNGTNIVLVNRRGGTGANFVNTVLSDSASTAIGSGRAPFDGIYRPDASLAPLLGKNAHGTWKLWIENRAAGHTGTLVNWSLILTPATVTTSSVASSDVSYADLSPVPPPYVPPRPRPGITPGTVHAAG